MSDSLPFLTIDFPPLGGEIKVRDEDFFVEEITRYDASGQGTHTYALIEKKGVGTTEALGRIARALHIKRRDIGYAGLKDAHAVTRQWISIEHIGAERLQNLDVPNVRFIQFNTHSNKIKFGHLAGNRFVIRLRNLMLPLQQAEKLAKDILSMLATKGVPNYFGPQRFGNRKNNHLLGEAIVRDDTEEFIDLFLGRPDDTDSASLSPARKLYEQGHYQEAIDAWPRTSSEHRRALRAIVKSRGKKRKAFDIVDRHLKGLLVSAYQSELFNKVLTARMPHIDRLLLGDFAYKHANGACFQVQDADLEQPRCDRFEISPTGPLIGLRTTRLTGPAGEIENAILQQAKLQETDLRRMKRFGGRGGRRPLRFQPRNHHVAAESDDLGQYLKLQFELDPGCYATTVIAEITKKPTT